MEHVDKRRKLLAVAIVVLSLAGWGLLDYFQGAPVRDIVGMLLFSGIMISLGGWLVLRLSRPKKQKAQRDSDS